jgi:hypothetical protein
MAEITTRAQFDYPDADHADIASGDGAAAIPAPDAWRRRDRCQADDAAIRAHLELLRAPDWAGRVLAVRAGMHAEAGQAGIRISTYLYGNSAALTNS